jgi:hypothetical protein
MEFHVNAALAGDPLVQPVRDVNHIIPAILGLSFEIRGAALGPEKPHHQAEMQGIVLLKSHEAKISLDMVDKLSHIQRAFT